MLEHVFDFDAVLEALVRRARIGTLFCFSFPLGPWEAEHQGQNSRGHVRLVLPRDCRELFAGHDLLALVAFVSPGHWRGWTMCALRYRGGGFRRINWARHWDSLA